MRRPALGLCVLCIDPTLEYFVPKGGGAVLLRVCPRPGSVGKRWGQRSSDSHPRVLIAGPCPRYLLYVFPQMREI